MSKYKVGSNQYRRKAKTVNTYRGGMSLLGFAIIMAFMYDLNITFNPSQSAASESVVINTTQKANPAESVRVVEQVSTPAATLTPTPTPTKEILDYINTIFRKDAKVAIAVMKNECNPQNKLFPTCHKTITSKEYSVGIFQINIQSATSKVHYNRIPGETLEEKVEWLKDPFNNTLMAYWIFQNSGWYPWTAYTSGNYLKDM